MICIQIIWKTFSVFFNVIPMSLAKCFGEELARSFQNFFHTKTISAHYNKALNLESMDNTKETIEITCKNRFCNHFLLISRLGVFCMLFDNLFVLFYLFHNTDNPWCNNHFHNVGLLDYIQFLLLYILKSLQISVIISL